MSIMEEIPLLRESVTYSRRLTRAAQSFAESRYHFHRRINWSYRYSNLFYLYESNLFQALPDKYIQGDVSTEPQLDDVYVNQLSGKQIVNVVMKVAAHTLFAFIGRLAERTIRRAQLNIYRKAYVDDIELVYDPEQPSVVRAVYPFPINLKRQLRYLRFLHQKGYQYKLSGYPYGKLDFIYFLRKRNVRALMRMESRAQIRHAQEVSGLGVTTVQLSDEFDIGSLDFTRALTRFGTVVVNSAHGVGKYFPVHAYEKFETLTLKQQAYYKAIKPCKYSLRRLNDFSKKKSSTNNDDFLGIVFISQIFYGVSPLIFQAENVVIRELASVLKLGLKAKLWYKPHPNNHDPSTPIGFEKLSKLEDINNERTVFVSLFSTCQIDPAFKGEKLLIRESLIRPEIAFDDTEKIIDSINITNYIKHIGVF